MTIETVLSIMENLSADIKKDKEKNAQDALLNEGALRAISVLASRLAEAMEKEEAILANGTEASQKEESAKEAPPIGDI